MRVTASENKTFDIELKGLNTVQVHYLASLVQNPMCDPAKEQPEISELRKVLFTECKQVFNRPVEE